MRNTKVQFREWDLTPKAFEIYSNSSFYFYKDTHEIYYVSDAPSVNPTKVGTLEDVEEYLLSFIY